MKHLFSRLRYISLYALIICCFTIPKAHAQFTSLVDDSQTQVLPDSSKTYFIPDVTEKKMGWSDRRFKLLTLKLGFAPILDYNYISQDDDNIEQVGEQENRFDIRSARMMFKGKINFKNPWQYLISVEYKGKDRPDGADSFGLTDLRFVIPIGLKNEIYVGKLKETFIYEMVGDAANLPHMERLLSPFFKSRNTGMIYKHFFKNDRATFSAGWFNSWIDNDYSFSESANTFTARITGLPKWYQDGAQYIHMGLGVRYVEAQDGVIRLKGKNESNITSNFVDTGNIEANSQFNLSLEQLWSLENFSVLLEYVHSWVDTDFGYEQFSGFYATGSYVLSGDPRPYDKRSAYARRIMPEGKYGALELVGRVGRINLDSSTIDGGILYRWDIGLNWWATQYWKAGIIYGIGNLKKDDVVGVTNSIQMRIQWIY